MRVDTLRADFHHGSMPPLSADTIELLRAAIQTGLSARGLPDRGAPAELAEAAAVLRSARSVVMTTGFCIPATMTGETDGPPGAAVLAAALARRGTTVHLVTDQFSVELVRACLSVLGVNAAAPGVTVSEVPYLDAQDWCRDLFVRVRPDVVVAVERPGAAADGRPYSMRGEVLSAVSADTDTLFTEAQRLAIPTIAVGDGGNELGMGRIRNLVLAGVPLGTLISAETVADIVVTARISNWGAYAIVALLGLPAGPPLLHTPEQEEALLRTVADLGGVDGVSLRAEPTVDGVSLEANRDLVGLLGRIVSPLRSREWGGCGGQSPTQ
ncbi:MAG: DUF4392 domain-containing protein [Spirochaetaceae bacterium]|nr:MAG: DUF4392 domain-containing protein [Spirochaetaceae bacterium]